MPTISITARAIKVSVPLPATELLALHCPEGGRPRIALRIRTPDRTVEADIASKALRKAQTTIRENGPDATFVMVQGKLGAGDQILEAGLIAQPKMPKPVAAEAA